MHLPLQRDFVLNSLGQNSAERGEGRRKRGTEWAEAGRWGRVESRAAGPAVWRVAWGIGEGGWRPRELAGRGLA